MNRKILSFLLIITGALFFCLMMIYALFLIEEQSLIIFLGIFIFFYFINLFFVYDNFSKEHNSKQARLSWTIILIFLPFIGTFFYFVGGFSSIRIKKKLRNLFTLENETVELENRYQKPHKIELEIFLKNLNLQNRKVITNSDFTIYDNGAKKFNALIKDLSAAEKFINIQYFIINDGIVWKKIEKILLEKANNGVKVNILTDFFGCLQTKEKVFKEIRNSNIKFKIVNPTKFFLNGGHLNYRAHNKFVIIDNKIAYFGGMNLGDDYSNLYQKYGTWIDLQIAFRGEIVNEMNNHFINQWEYWVGGKIERAELNSVNRESNIQFFADAPNFKESIFLKYFIEMINKSNKKIRIVTPYVVFPREVFEAFFEARKRGVEIELITAGRADKKTAYEIGKIYLKKLLNIGIKVYRMDNMFIHSKFFLFDNNSLITGTTNLDYRAIYLHFESNLLIHDEKLYLELEKVFEKYKIHANLLDKSEYDKFSYVLKSPLYHFISPMF